jgi:hypothetical protein
MNDYSELKLLAQCVGGLLMLQKQQAYIMNHEERCALRQFLGEVNPVTVLRMIEEIEKLTTENVELRKDKSEPCDGCFMADAEALRKDAERMKKATEFVQRLCDSAGTQPSVATGYLHDILSVMSKDG